VRGVGPGEDSKHPIRGCGGGTRQQRNVMFDSYSIYKDAVSRVARVPGMAALFFQLNMNVSS